MERACWFVFLLLAAGSAIAQVTQGPAKSSASFSELARYADRLKDDFGKRNPDGVRLANEIRAYSSELSRLEERFQIPRMYTKNMRLQVEAVEKFIVDGGRTKASADAARLVAEDLKLKAEFARKNPSKPFRLVSVTVRTKRKANEEGGCEVWYTPRAWAPDPPKAKKDRFKKLSSPTQSNLAPGNYVMWTIRDGKEGKHTPVPVGKGGATKDDVDLPVPATSGHESDEP